MLHNGSPVSTNPSLPLHRWRSWLSPAPALPSAQTGTTPGTPDRSHYHANAGTCGPITHSPELPGGPGPRVYLSCRRRRESSQNKLLLRSRPRAWGRTRGWDRRGNGGGESSPSSVLLAVQSGRQLCVTAGGSQQRWANIDSIYIFKGDKETACTVRKAVSTRCVPRCAITFLWLSIQCTRAFFFFLLSLCVEVICRGLQQHTKTHSGVKAFFVIIMELFWMSPATIFRS